MSNGIPYDPLLVHYLAAELSTRLSGRSCAATPLFAAERTALLPLDRGEALQLDLHPRRGWVRLVPYESEPEELDAEVTGVGAPPDERLLEIRVQSRERFRAGSRRLIVELHGNQWNAVLVSDDDRRILSILWSRIAGARTLRTGAVYEPPPGRPRYGAAAPPREEALARWTAEIGAREPVERRGALLSGFAYTGSATAAALLGPAAEVADPAEVEAAFARWWRVRSLPPVQPVLLRLSGRSLPYPLPLPGVESDPVGSLLEGMERIAGRAGAERAVEGPGVAFIRRRREAAARRLARLEAQRGRAGEAVRLRHRGDLLLARKRLVPHGASTVRLQDWDGRLVQVELDPALSAAENATRLYDEARKRERAEARLPELISAAAAEAERWERALLEAESGEVPAWVAEAAGGEPEEGEPESRPYRRYRTSGGLEVRVGKGARANDELTFGHCRPNDVWLHARSVPGSHVVLRWSRPHDAPPARDLEEAAVLAALHSRARSSGLVPVDWTRRKYVRKPRGAAPGAVVPQQVRTLIVEPDPAVEERLRAE